MQARDWPSGQWAREGCREEQLCVKPEEGEGGALQIRGRRACQAAEQQGQLHEVGVGLVCGKENRDREGKWEETRSETQ